MSLGNYNTGFIEGTQISWNSLTYSDTASKNCIDNKPKDDKIAENLKKLSQKILQPVKSRFGDIIISSAYRCSELNGAVGGSREKSAFNWTSSRFLFT